MVATDFKRLFLRGIRWDATDAGISLADGLKLSARSQLTRTSTGLYLIGTAGNGHTASFSVPVGLRDSSPQEIAGMIEEFITRYDAAVAALAAAGNASPSDDQILTEMLALMTAVTEVYSDFSQLRTGGCPV